MSKMRIHLFVAMALFMITGACPLLTPPVQAAPSPEDMADDIDEINDRLDAVERKTLMDKINIGAAVRMRFDYFTFKDFDANSAQYVEHMPSTRFRLNLKADITKNLKFHSRLSMQTNWNDWDTAPYWANPPMLGVRGRGDTSLKVERAYVDYFFDLIPRVPMALTFGRLPTTDGLPTNLRENTPRKSVYPALVFDMESDGAALSFDLSDLTDLPGSAFRFVYWRFVKDNDISPFLSNDPSGLPDDNVFIFQLETELSGDLRDTLVILNYVYVPTMTPTPPERMQDIWNDTVAFGGPVTVSGGSNVFGPLTDNLGSFHIITGYVQAERFLDQPLDWYLGGKYNRINATGPPASYTITGSPQAPPFIPIGFASDLNDEDKNGYAIQAGLRVTFPCSFLKDPKLGLDYNYGSRYLMPGSWGSEDPLNSLDVRGHAVSVYYIQPITRHFLVRAGHTSMKIDYTSNDPWFGERNAADQYANNTYFLLDVKF